MERLDVCFVYAHCDDFETSVGGLAIRLANAGHRITSVVATSARIKDGMSTREWTREMEVREAESKTAHEYVNAQPIFFRIPTGKLLYESENFVSKLGKMFSLNKPNAVFTFSPIDVHPDHCALHPVVREFTMAKGVNTEYFHSEVCAGTTLPYPQTMKFIPDYYCDISDVIESKRKMVMAHKSQNPEGLYRSNEQLWKKRALDLRGLDWKQRMSAAWYCNTTFAEGYVRLTREGPLHPELAKYMIPSPHSNLVETLCGGEYVFANAQRVVADSAITGEKALFNL